MEKTLTLAQRLFVSLPMNTDFIKGLIYHYLSSAQIVDIMKDWSISFRQIYTDANACAIKSTRIMKGNVQMNLRPPTPPNGQRLYIARSATSRRCISWKFLLCYNVLMATITIPNEITKEGFVVLPRREYERLLVSFLPGKEVTLTLSQKKRLQSARVNLSKGKFLTLNELGKKLGIKNWSGGLQGSL